MDTQHKDLNSIRVLTTQSLDLTYAHIIELHIGLLGLVLFLGELVLELLLLY
jgi:hypothetical protein